jgi:hypothetical protein
MTLAIAFAVLQIEPPGHLARVTELKAKDELREDNSAKTVHQSDSALLRTSRTTYAKGRPQGTESGKAPIDNMT